MSGRRTNHLLLLALGVLAVAIYANAFGGEFVYDDITLVRDNPRIRSLGCMGEIFSTNWWGDLGNRGLYRPIAMATYAINHAVTGLSHGGFLAVNLLLHALVSVLVVRLATALGLGRNAALVSGALFAVHPVHVEAVVTAVGRTELLCTAGFLLGLLAHRRGRPGLAAIWAGLAMLSKENAFTFPAVAWLLDWSLPRRDPDGPTRQPWAHYGVYVGLAAVLLGIRSLVLGAPALTAAGIPFVDNPIIPHTTNALGNTYGATWFEGRATALAVLVDYARLLVWPARLSADYSFAQIEVASSMTAASWSGVMLVLGTLIGTFACRHQAAVLGFGLGFFAITFALTSNLLFPIGTICGERLLYLPSAGFVLAIGALVHAVRGPGQRVVLLVAVVLSALAVGRVVTRNPDWHSTRTLWEATVETSPRSAKARLALGRELGIAAGTSDPDLLARAREHLETALSIYPDAADARLALGNVLVVSGKLQRGVAEYREALRIAPDYASAWASLGATCMQIAARRNGDPSWLGEARAALDRAIQLAPESPETAGAYLNRAQLNDYEGRPDRARADRDQAARLSPGR